MDARVDRPTANNRNIVHALHARSTGTATRGDLLSYAENSAATLTSLNRKADLPARTRSTFIAAFSRDGDLVASCHGDHNVHVCEVATGRLVQTLSGHVRSPWCVQFHPDNDQILASGCLNGEVRVWDLRGGGSESWTPSGEETTTISSLSFHPSDHVVMVAAGSEIHFWDWSLPKPFASVKTNSGEKVRLARFSLLGDYILTGVANLTDAHSGEEEGNPPNQEETPSTADWGPPTLLNPSFVDPPERGSLLAWLRNGRHRMSQASGSSRTTGSWGRTSARNPQRPRSNSRSNIRTRMNQGRRNRRLDQADPSDIIQSDIIQSDDLTAGLGQFPTDSAGQPTDPRLDNVLLSQSSLSQPPLPIVSQPPLRNITPLQPSLQSTALSQPPLGSTTLPQPPLPSTTLPQPPLGSTAVPQPLLPSTTMSQPPLRSRIMSNLGNITPSQPSLPSITLPQPPLRLSSPSPRQRLLATSSRQPSPPGEHSFARDHERILHASVSVNAEIQHQYNRLQLLREERRRLEIRLRQLQSDAPPPVEEEQRFPRVEEGASAMEDDLTSILASRIQDRILHSLGGPGVEMEVAMATEPPLELRVNPTFHRAGPEVPGPTAPGLLEFAGTPQREIRLRRLRRPASRARASHLRSHINHILSLYPDPNRALLDASGYKLQWWDFSRLTLPEISRPDVNVIVPSCKIYNDSSLDVSRDGRRLACFVPGEQGFNTNVAQVSVFSLEPSSLGSLLYRRVVGSSAVCLSLSPLGNYLAVGLKRRDYLRENARPPVAQVLKLNKTGESPTSVVHFVTHPVQPDTPQRYVNINTIAWLPGVGRGLVYGTNNGELRICST